MAIFGPPPDVIEKCRLCIHEHIEARSMFAFLVEAYEDDNRIFQRMNLWMLHTDLTTNEFKGLLTREASRVSRVLQEFRKAVTYHSDMAQKYQRVLEGEIQLGEIEVEKPEFSFDDIAQGFNP